MALDPEELKSETPKELRSAIKATIELTIKQIINLSNNSNYTQIEKDNFIPNKTTLIHRGREISEIWIMGVIEKINKSGSLITLQVNDYTGILLVRLLLYDGVEQTELLNKIRKIIPNNWYRILGKIDRNKNNVGLLLFNLWEITDKNEIAFYGLNIIHQDLVLKLNPSEKEQLKQNNIKQQNKYQREIESIAKSYKKK